MHDSKNVFFEARLRSANPALWSKFKPLHRDQAQRAVYFCELAKFIEDLGLGNAFERSALSLEPTHPIQPSRVGKKIAEVTGIHSLSTRYSDLKLSLLSMPMVASVAPDSEVARMFNGPLRAPLYLLDPLYGFGYFPSEDGKFRNHCFAIDFWQARLKSMPAGLASDLWKNRSDNMLSGGAFSGRHLFLNIVPPEPDPFKRSMAPEITVSSEEHLNEIVAALQEGAKKMPNVELWFRGQRKDYQVPDRSELVKYRITPYSNIQESDFTPSLYRNFDKSLENINLYEAQLFEIAQWVETARKFIPDNPLLVSGFTQSTPHALSADGLTSFQRGLVLQQYGAPSAYLDISSDPFVAAWFATHECMQSSSGQLRFNRNSWTNPDPRSWPTIFVFPLVRGAHPFLDLSSILPESMALRPRRQSCGLLGGAGNMARNYCARYLGLKLRLDPKFALKKPLDPSFLFPSAREDHALAALEEAGFSSGNRHYPMTYYLSA
jgi:hypothetical protein